MESFGLGYEAIEINPRLITTVSAFGGQGRLEQPGLRR